MLTVESEVEALMRFYSCCVCFDPVWCHWWVACHLLRACCSWPLPLRMLFMFSGDFYTLLRLFFSCFSASNFQRFMFLGICLGVFIAFSLYLFPRSCKGRIVEVKIVPIVLFSNMIFGF